MSLVTMKVLLQDAQKGKYGVGSFNFFGLENLQGIIEAAANKQSPVMVQASPGAVRHFGVKAISKIVDGVSDDFGLPVALHLDHAKDYEIIYQCIDYGFSSVMVDASKKSFDENIQMSRKVVEYAARYGVSVEAELGTIGGTEEEVTLRSEDALYTNPNDAATFIEATGIDALAVAVGTAHGFYKVKPQLDFDRIGKIRSLTNIGLVLHGGTGVPDDDLKKTISLGINKINVGTELWLNGYGNTMKKYASIMPKDSDPRKVMKHVRDECRKIVEEKIDVFGSAGKVIKL